MKEEVKSISKKVKIKFNALVTPKVELNPKTGKYELVTTGNDFRNDIIGLLTEEGRTAEETKKFQGMRTSLLMRNGMMTLNEALNLLYGTVTDSDNKQYYYKDEIVVVDEELAKYYLNTPCGGTFLLRDENKKLVETNHLANIDDRGGFYEAKDMARFKREHKPVMLAEVYNG